jgi:hypothetical protein
MINHFSSSVIIDHRRPHRHRNAAAEAPSTTSLSKAFPGERRPPLLCPAPPRCFPHAHHGDQTMVRSLPHWRQPRHRVGRGCGDRVVCSLQPRVAGVGQLGRRSHFGSLGVVDPGSAGPWIQARFRSKIVHVFFFFPDFVIRFKF